VPVRWYHNVPLVSWLALRGRCSSCGAGFSVRYLIVEVASAAMSVGVFAWMMATGSDQPLWFRLASYLVHFFFAGTLLVLSFIDLATFLLPNRITYPAIPVFAVAAVLLGRPWAPAFLGIVAGYLSLRLLADVYRWLTGREGMGYGDAKLLALIGGFLGWRALLPTVFLAAFQGSIVGIVMGISAKRKGTTSSIRLVRLPFGPFLSLGALEAMIWIDALHRLFPFL
jgi:leader peptidase (prepilin peptidase)/N-methyltransferase